MNALPLPPPQDAAITLARIEVKLDEALKDTADHETRLRALEARNWPRQSVNLWVSVCAALAAVATVVEGLLIR